MILKLPPSSAKSVLRVSPASGFRNAVAALRTIAAMLMPTIAPSRKVTLPSPFRFCTSLRSVLPRVVSASSALAVPSSRSKSAAAPEERQRLQALEPELLADRRHAVLERDLERAAAAAAIQRELLERRLQRVALQGQAEHGGAELEPAHR